MTNVEIGIIVVAALIPIIALVILFPFKKKKKSKSSTGSAVEKTTMEQPKPASEDTNPATTGLTTASLDSSEFLDYLKEKTKMVKKPERKDVDVNLGEFDDELFSDMDFVRRRNQKKEKSVAQQIQDLSPELKALMISGVLDRKDY